MCLSTNTTDFYPFEKFKEAEIPLVFFDKVPESKTYNTICIADAPAAIIAAEWLIAKKKQNILALFGDSNLLISKTRAAAFQKITAPHKNITVHYQYCNSAEAAKKVSKLYFSKKQKPDALFCMSDEILIGAMKSLQILEVDFAN